MRPRAARQAGAAYGCGGFLRCRVGLQRCGWAHQPCGRQQLPRPGVCEQRAGVRQRQAARIRAQNLLHERFDEAAGGRQGGRRRSQCQPPAPQAVDRCRHPRKLVQQAFVARLSFKHHIQRQTARAGGGGCDLRTPPQNAAALLQGDRAKEFGGGLRSQVGPGRRCQFHGQPQRMPVGGRYGLPRLAYVVPPE